MTGTNYPILSIDHPPNPPRRTQQTNAHPYPLTLPTLPLPHPQSETDAPVGAMQGNCAWQTYVTGRRLNVAFPDLQAVYQAREFILLSPVSYMSLHIICIFYMLYGGFQAVYQARVSLREACMHARHTTLVYTVVVIRFWMV